MSQMEAMSKLRSALLRLLSSIYWALCDDLLKIASLCVRAANSLNRRAKEIHP